jgi:hypothetical protein
MRGRSDALDGTFGRAESADRGASCQFDVSLRGRVLSSLVFPVVLAAVVLIVATAAFRLRGLHRWAFLRESAVVLSAYFVYFLIRGATEGRATEAIHRALALERLEERFGIFFEVELQQAVIDWSWLIELANGAYIWAHWPLIGAVGLWLYFTQHERYRVYRTTMLISGAVGVVIFALFPTAPPRLANPDVIDTVVDRTDIYRVMQPPLLTNQYAAVPSLHFGWNLLMGIAMVRESNQLTVRLLGWLSPPAMLVATIVTANHYVLDAVAGGAIVLVALFLVERRPRFVRSRRAQAVDPDRCRASRPARPAEQARQREGAPGS